MSRILRLSLALVALSPLVASHPLSRRDECTSPRQVMPWGNLTADEKTGYLDASVCLFNQPAKLEIGGSVTRWDEFQYNHIHQAGWIHQVGQFLPWHRYFVAVHANALSDECGYDGPIPYWDEISDSELSDILDSELFQSDAFGGNGVGTTECIEDGPFANFSLHAAVSSGGGRGGSSSGNQTCIFRSLSLQNLQTSNAAGVNKCLALDTFAEAWPCIEGGPHPGGHGGVGGLMVNVANSPGDPVFFLHHAFIDMLWWRWQAEDLDTRLTDISGNNSPTSSNSCSSQGQTCPDASILDYDGDDGNTTTLNHVLWMMDLFPNATVADVMDVNSPTICLEYLWN